MLIRMMAALILTIFSLEVHSAERQPNNIISLPEGPYYSPFVVVVDKANRKTSVWKAQDGRAFQVAEYVSDQGKKDGDKRAIGDHRTPEGVYFFQELYEGENLDYSLYGLRAFTTNYPNLFDQRDGKTGSGIWLHAIPDTESLERGSRGCVVIRNKSILEISEYIALGRTPLVINDANAYSTPQEIKGLQTKLRQFIESWKKSWVAKDIETYMSHYSEPGFQSMKMNWTKWKTYKMGLNEKYKEIGIEFSEPVVLAHKGDVVVRMLQKYRSDMHEDFGEKTLYIRSEGGQPRIIAETWENRAGNSQAISQFEMEKPNQRKISSTETDVSSLQN